MSIIALIIALIIIYWLIHRLRTTNRKLSYFFDALGNDDYTLRFTETQGLPSEKMLNHSLNRIKTLIQNTRLEIQQKEKYYLIRLIFKRFLFINISLSLVLSYKIILYLHIP